MIRKKEVKDGLNVLIQIRLLLSSHGNINSLSFNVRKTPILKHYGFCFYTQAAAPVGLDQEIKSRRFGIQLEDTTCVFRRWGCSEDDISRLFLRQPALRRMDLANLQSKLNALRGLGATSTDLIKIIDRRPRLLHWRMNQSLDARLKYLQSLFESKEVLLKAISRDPSLLIYDLHNKIIPVIEIYERMGVSRADFISMLLARPTLIPRTSLNEEKLDYIQRTGVHKESKMYKYVITLFAISRTETIQEKIANFEKFGLSEDQVLHLFGRCPLMLTFSVDKVQRSMTYILDTIKLTASVVPQYPFLLYYNLETLLRPRFLLAGKIQELGLVPQIKGPNLFMALRMNEKRFIKVFVECHSKDLAKELLEYYIHAKCLKQLAESSKKNVHKRFPF